MSTPDHAVVPAIRVLIVDDHPVFRLGLQAMVSSIQGFTVIGEAANAAMAAELATRLMPDIILMDLDLGLGVDSGIDATRALRRHHPIPVLILTMLEDDDSVFAAIRAGASGYLLKTATPAEIERGIRAVANGDVLLAAGVAQRALGFLTATRTTGSPFPELTEREREVLDLVARGLDNLTISRRLAVSDKTIRNYLYNVTAKLHVTSRAQVIVRAREAGLGRGD